MSIVSKVFLVDDDLSIRRSLERSLKHHGYLVETFESGEALLNQISNECFGCIILDIAMSGMSGIQVQNELIRRKIRVPIIFMTGHGDVPTSVRAIKSGAIDFFEKPFDVDHLLAKVEEAIKRDEHRYNGATINAEIIERFQTLTKREVDVMADLVAGVAAKSNKEVARDIGISHRTVEEYRARIMKKMGAVSITHLVEMAKVCEIYEDDG